MYNVFDFSTIVSSASAVYIPRKVWHEVINNLPSIYCTKANLRLPWEFASPKKQILFACTCRVVGCTCTVHVCASEERHGPGKGKLRLQTRKYWDTLAFWGRLVRLSMLTYAILSGNALALSSEFINKCNNQIDEANFNTNSASSPVQVCSVLRLKRSNNKCQHQQQHWMIKIVEVTAQRAMCPNAQVTIASTKVIYFSFLCFTCLAKIVVAAYFKY